MKKAFQDSHISTCAKCFHICSMKHMWQINQQEIHVFRISQISHTWNGQPLFHINAWRTQTSSWTIRNINVIYWYRSVASDLDLYSLIDDQSVYPIESIRLVMTEVLKPSAVEIKMYIELDSSCAFSLQSLLSYLYNVSHYFRLQCILHRIFERGLECIEYTCIIQHHLVFSQG